MADNTAALDRLTESVRKVGIGVTEVAGALRAHPAAQDDSGRLNSMADALDSAATTLSGIAATIEAPVADPTPAPVTEPAPTFETTEHDPNGGSVETPPVDATNDPAPAEPTPTPETTATDTLTLDTPAPAAEDSATDGA